MASGLGFRVQGSRFRLEGMYWAGGGGAGVYDL